jgi:cell fate regulator YaaT (PSP1 superfamily)
LSINHFVRVGLFGQVGRFRSVDATRYPRGTRVVVRTVRGMELGEVLSSPAESFETDGVEMPGESGPVAVADGAILRRMTIEDQLLEARLERNRSDAFDACCRRLTELGIAAPLLDVEHLFDGRGLYFYFLGQPPAEAEQLTAELANVYDANVQFRQFAETLTAGCGPDCGTEKAGGGGCSSCATGCAVASACKAH